VSSIITALTGPVSTLLTNVIDRIFPDKDAQAAQRAQLILQAQQLDTQLQQGQLAIDQAEATNTSLFVSGWRPFIGWVCGAAFAYHLILEPIISYVMANTGHTVALPVFDVTTLTTTLFGMLGLGAMRTVEKLGDKSQLPWQQ
jgi:hypothetical protein